MTILITFMKKLTMNLSFLPKILLIFTLVLTNSCGVPDFAKPSKVSRDTPMNAKERARKNLEEGKGVSLKGLVSGPKSTNYDCLWDSYPFDNTPFGIPIKKNNNIVHMFGNFCSPECAAAYCFTINDNVWEKYSLINDIFH